MSYDAFAIKERYDKIAELEDIKEKSASFRVLIPRFLIKKYLSSNDSVLDAAGGTGMNAIFMAPSCKSVTLVDISPNILIHARNNIKSQGLRSKIRVVEADITNLSLFQDATFNFVVCVGAALSYALNKREWAIQELNRVAKRGATIIVQVQSKYGIIGSKIRKGLLKESVNIHENSEFIDGMGVKSHLYTPEEINGLLQKNGFRVVETATNPVFTSFCEMDELMGNEEEFKSLEFLEYEYCTNPELLGLGHHIVVVARKENYSRFPW